MERLLECEITTSATKKEKSEETNEQNEFKEEKEFGCEKCDKRFATKSPSTMYSLYMRRATLCMCRLCRKVC